jgi:hypothetical protein
MDGVFDFRLYREGITVEVIWGMQQAPLRTLGKSWLQGSKEDHTSEVAIPDIV